MSGIDLLQSVQFVTVKGRRLAVLDASDWEAFIEWLETIEDTQSVREALEELKRAGGDRQKAGWVEWDKVREELE